MDSLQWVTCNEANQNLEHKRLHCLQPSLNLSKPRHIERRKILCVFRLDSKEYPYLHVATPSQLSLAPTIPIILSRVKPTLHKMNPCLYLVYKSMFTQHKIQHPLNVVPQINTEQETTSQFLAIKKLIS